MKKNRNLLSLTQTFMLVWKSSAKYTSISMTLNFFRGFFPLVILYLMKLLIDLVQQSATVDDKQIVVNELFMIVAITGFVYFLNEISSSLSLYIKEKQSKKTGDYIFDLIHTKASELDLEHFENSEYQDMLFRARVEGQYRPTSIIHSLIKILQNSISLILMIVLLSFFHWSVILILLIATIPGILIKLKYSGLIYLLKKKTTHTERKMRYFNWMLTSQDFVKEVKVFDLGTFFKSKFTEHRNDLHNEKIKIISKQTITELVSKTATTIAIFISYAFICYRAIYGYISIGDLVMYFLALQRGLQFLKEIMTASSSLYEDNLFLTDLHDFLSLESKIENKETKDLCPSLNSIEIKNVSYAYNETNIDALTNISFEIKKGETIAFVGKNGAGKSTLVKILCKLYDVKSGNIVINNKDLNTIDIKSYRNKIAVIFQDFTKYNLTFKENIQLGNINADIDENKIVNSAKNSGINTLIDSLPNKINTLLGKVFKGGTNLSIGEWQKLALSRAFYKDAELIILDEPTSAMDTIAEEDFLKNFKILTQEKLSVIVSHKLSTLKLADKILFFENNKIIETGTHTELINLKGKYFEMFS